MKFSRFPYKDKSENTFIYYVTGVDNMAQCPDCYKYSYLFEKDGKVSHIA